MPRFCFIPNRDQNLVLFLWTKLYRYAVGKTGGNFLKLTTHYTTCLSQHSAEIDSLIEAITEPQLGNNVGISPKAWQETEIQSAFSMLGRRTPLS
eukprot:6281611-Amphidinium_carterae.1